MKPLSPLRYSISLLVSPSLQGPRVSGGARNGISKGDVCGRSELSDSGWWRQQELQNQVPIQADSPGLGDCVQVHLLPCALVFTSIKRRCCKMGEKSPLSLKTKITLRDTEDMSLS